MKRTSRGLAALFVCLGMAVLPARAQSVHFGLGGGATAPNGDLKNDANIGWHAQAMVGFSLPAMPVSFRLDGVYHKFSLKETDAGDARVWGGSLDAIVHLPVPVVSPYLIGGPGYYNLKSYQSTESVNKFGWNAGGGVSFHLSHSVTSFVEARYTQILTDGQHTNFIPVTFGVMLR